MSGRRADRIPPSGGSAARCSNQSTVKPSLTGEGPVHLRDGIRTSTHPRLANAVKENHPPQAGKKLH